MSAPVRHRAWTRGRNAERIAAWVLRLKGYQILEERLASRFGEIDLVARRGGVLVFVEVKARKDVETGLGSISHRQRTRIRRAAEAFASTRGWQGRCRFDAIVVSPGAFGLPRVTHFPAAWD